MGIKLRDLSSPKKIKIKSRKIIFSKSLDHERIHLHQFDQNASRAPSDRSAGFRQSRYWHASSRTFQSSFAQVLASAPDSCLAVLLT